MSRIRRLWAGQYLGFGALIAASALIGRRLALAPERWLWLLALVPLGRGAADLGHLRDVRGVRRGRCLAGGRLGVSEPRRSARAALDAGMALS